MEKKKKKRKKADVALTSYHIVYFKGNATSLPDCAKFLSIPYSN